MFWVGWKRLDSSSIVLCIRCAETPFGRHCSSLGISVAYIDMEHTVLMGYQLRKIYTIPGTLVPMYVSTFPIPNLEQGVLNLLSGLSIHSMVH